MGFSLFIESKMKILSIFLSLTYVYAKAGKGLLGQSGPPWGAGTYFLWMSTFRRAINPLFDMTNGDQDSKVVDDVMDRKGWKKCEWDEVHVPRKGTGAELDVIQDGLDSGYKSRFNADYPWSERWDANPCKEDAPEWDEYRHYLIVKMVQDVCDGTMKEWIDEWRSPPGMVEHACSMCYNAHNPACYIDHLGGYVALKFDRSTQGNPVDLYYNNMPRNLAHCRGNPPKCPKNPEPGHVPQSIYPCNQPHCIGGYVYKRNVTSTDFD